MRFHRDLFVDGNGDSKRVDKAVLLLTAVLDGITKDGIYNSQLLKVEDWGEGWIKVRCIEGGECYNVSANFLARNLRLAHALTYASVQGRSCKGSVALFDTNHQRFTRRHLVMGLSRCRSAGEVWLAD